MRSALSSAYLASLLTINSSCEGGREGGREGGENIPLFLKRAILNRPAAVHVLEVRLEPVSARGGPCHHSPLVPLSPKGGSMSSP